jgi:toxin YoeB
LEFDAAFEDLAWRVEQERAQALRIIRLIRETQREPFTGLGKPEPLKHELSDCWSRRISQEASRRLPSAERQDTDTGLPLPLLINAVLSIFVRRHRFSP